MKERSKTMKRTARHNKLHLLCKANGQAFRSFRRNMIFYKGKFICFGLLISLCIALVLTGFSTMKSFQKQAAAPLLSTNINQLYLNFHTSAYETTPNLDTLKQFAASNSDVIKGILPYLTTNTDLRQNKTRVSANAVGTNDEFINYENLSLKEGRFFRHFDIEDGKKVIVLGSQIAEKLFPHDTALGQLISCGTENYKVIGTLSEEEIGYQNAVFFPHTTHRQIFQTPVLNQFLVIPESGKEAQTKSILQSYLTDELKDVTRFSLYTQSNLISKTNPITASCLWIIWLGTILSLFLLGLLLFWHLWIYFKRMNKEWALRFNAGAHPLQIFWQIVIESKYHGVFFMLTGIILGTVMTILTVFFLNLPFTLSFLALLCLFLGIPTLSVIYGFYFAIKAIKKEMQGGINKY